MKITDYQELTTPDPEGDYTVIAYGGQSYKVLLGNFNTSADPKKQIPVITDVMGENELVVNVTNTPVGSSTNHPGVVIPAGDVNFTTNYTLLGGEIFEAVVYIDFVNAQKFGLAVDSINNKIWFDYTPNTLSGKCQSGGSTSTTPATLTLGASGWYRLKFVVNAAITKVDFYVYDSTGALVLNSSVTSNIPSAPNSASGAFTSLAGGGSADWIAFYNNTELVR